MNKKDYDAYQKKYRDVPKGYFDRFLYIIQTLKLKETDIEILKKSMRRLLHAKWNRLNFVFYMKPAATPRPRFVRKTGIVFVGGAADNHALFGKYMKDNRDQFDIITTPTKLLVDTYMPIPTGMSRLEMILAELGLIRPISRPDWDNLGKTYSDMIQKHLLLEDSLVIDGRTRKFYSFKPRIEIRLDYMDQYETRYNKRKVEGWGAYKDPDVVDFIKEKDFLT